MTIVSQAFKQVNTAWWMISADTEQKNTLPDSVVHEQVRWSLFEATEF